MYKVLLNSLLVVLLAFSISSVKAEEVNKPDAFDNFDKYAETIMDKWQVPGMAIVVVKDGKPIYSKGFGVKDIDSEEKVDTETLFCLGSTTKAFNGTLLGILSEEKVLELDKPIKDQYPEFKVGDDYMTNHLTLRDLLLHRSGIPGYDAVWYRSDITSDELLNRLKYLKPNVGIREYWQYSNILFSSAGYIAAKLAGDRWDELVKEKILIPLDMKKTGFTADEVQKEANYASPHEVKQDKIVKVPFLNTDPIMPAGGMHSNADELANWLIMNLNNGKFNDKNIISPGMLKQVQTPQMAMIQPIGFKELGFSEYSLGWGYFPYRGEILIVHEGEIDGFKSHISFMPIQKIGLAILCNSNTTLPSAVSFDIYDRVLGKDYIDWGKRFEDKKRQAEEAEKKLATAQKSKKMRKTKPSHPLKDYAGKYFNPLFGEMIISYEDGKLKGFFREEFDIKHDLFDVFTSYDSDDPLTEELSMSFILDKEGNIDKVGMNIVPELPDDEYFKKIADDK